MEDKLYVFNYTQNRNKLFANLISIIDGILADGHVRDEEVLYLDTWLLEANQTIRNGVIKSLSTRVSKILADGVVSDDERSELKRHLNDIQRKILDIPDVDLFSSESDLHLLNGLCKGLISDRTLSEEEVRYLDWWLTQNGALKSNYPGKELYALVKEILSDGIITTEESENLHKALVDFTGCDLASGVVDGLSTKLPLDNTAEVSVENKTFCLTGVFLAGKRAHVEDLIKRNNGLISSGITKKIDFLVIGTLSSRDWKFSSHGRKIEKAVSYRDDEGAKLKIISEEMLFDALP
ncbi:TPA: NAD-dependent DNA ligase [Citrobacter koseri]|uniref:NAD-dependent DNA ligase n=1 Tax=Citrobacter koseri TaxID=545 RepID=A0AAQ0V6W1_CITKO|nr:MULTISPECIES: BRCT domain-containing protein [Citrobacter]OFV13476.1 NAD-dependent DNA ligase [Salmonella sp. HMSC13B08]DAU76009.1 MAG TPA: DNA ligase-like protein [Caudoviricetes sp.]HCJ7694143.1 NAD-dependent DNA ligase [Citrobacter freundii]ASE83908.1 NAD-dependent DNA ligase [Citrobacter koseri]ATF98217.1 NAD-dependent DNA ligase [Citrobacter koseri]